MHAEPGSAAPGCPPAMSPHPYSACASQEGVSRGKGCLAKENTDFSEHPVNTEKKRRRMGGKWNEQPGKEKGNPGALGSKDRADHTLSPASLCRRCLLLLILEKMWCVS